MDFFSTCTSCNHDECVSHQCSVCPTVNQSTRLHCTEEKMHIQSDVHIRSEICIRSDMQRNPIYAFHPTHSTRRDQIQPAKSQRTGLFSPSRRNGVMKWQTNDARHTCVSDSSPFPSPSTLHRCRWKWQTKYARHTCVYDSSHSAHAFSPTTSGVPGIVW